MGGRVTTYFGAWYHATKYALEAFSDALRMETKQFGINVAIIEPGGIKTPWGFIAADHLAESAKGGAYEQEAERTAEGMRKAVQWQHDEQSEDHCQGYQPCRQCPSSQDPLSHRFRCKAHRLHAQPSAHPLVRLDDDARKLKKKIAADFPVVSMLRIFAMVQAKAINSYRDRERAYFAYPSVKVFL